MVRRSWATLFVALLRAKPGPPQGGHAQALSLVVVAVIGKIYKRAVSFHAALAPLADDGAPATWIGMRNLSTRDVHVAERIMGATGRLSARTEKPVYRFRVFFDRADSVDAVTMRSIADAVLSELGADGLQAVMGGFNGTNPHRYVVVNRVHPIRETAWQPSNDYFGLMGCLRRLEREYGLRQVKSAN